MKIVQDDLVYIDSVAPGQVFLYENQFYLKIPPCYTHNGLPKHALCLSSNTLYCFTGLTQVQVKKAELRIL